MALWKDGPAKRVEVGILDGEAIEELLVTVLAGPIDTASLHQLVDRCRGNPQFLQELVHRSARNQSPVIFRIPRQARSPGDLTPARLPNSVFCMRERIPSVSRPYRTI
jgi:hypothetical protein